MKYLSFTSARSVSVVLSLLVLTACATTGQSPTLAKYSDAQIKRCYNSLTIAERDEAARRAKADAVGTALIPIVGPLIADAKEELYQEYERICLRKGVI
jgi:hypothetical protein